MVVWAARYKSARSKIVLRESIHTQSSLRKLRKLIGDSTGGESTEDSQGAGEGLDREDSHRDGGRNLFAIWISR